jgi:hypothetical protein
MVERDHLPLLSFPASERHICKTTRPRSVVGFTQRDKQLPPQRTKEETRCQSAPTTPDHLQEVHVCRLIRTENQNTPRIYLQCTGTPDELIWPNSYILFFLHTPNPLSLRGVLLRFFGVPCSREPHTMFILSEHIPLSPRETLEALAESLAKSCSRARSYQSLPSRTNPFEPLRDS